MCTSLLRQVFMSWGPCGMGGGDEKLQEKAEASKYMPGLLEGWGQWGTLEPCLDKTSHSPLVRATSSLMGHLNSSVRKESREVRDAGRAQAW